MKNFLLMLLDNVLWLVLWGLSLAAVIIGLWLFGQRQLRGAALAIGAGAFIAGALAYRKGWGGWIPWNFRQTRPSDELPGMSNLPGSSNYVSDVLDETPYRND